ncbi:hypothetical protein [Pontibacillus litoralis]|uniref:Uncharacterized protein n=1 Tax=Pontibacillus litoralis JSM 072002 TaxID=1385512 RepID=A0A0A5G766_9BACI|nr:hypothetical protein [Pontibacillus litoralis]KGX86940.1 hypothetical protein N784_03380 [Pontibacillus litoralis JSM 072002]
MNIILMKYHPDQHVVVNLSSCSVSSVAGGIQYREAVHIPISSTILINHQIYERKGGEAKVIIVYDYEGNGKVVESDITQQPPNNEALLQMANLYVNDELQVKALYGDIVEHGLKYETMSEPLLLYAPMDVPLSFTFQQTEFLFKGYCTRPNTWAILCLHAEEENPFVVIEIEFT